MTILRTRINRFKALNRCLDKIFKEADKHDLTNADLARISKLCLSTVQRLALNVTRFPRFETVEKLARVFNWTITLDEID